jgi:hypothetical protein
MARLCAMVKAQVRQVAPCGEKLSRAEMMRTQVSWNTSSACAASRAPRRRRTKRNSPPSWRA